MALVEAVVGVLHPLHAKNAEKHSLLVAVDVAVAVQVVAIYHQLVMQHLKIVLLVLAVNNIVLATAENQHQQ